MNPFKTARDRYESDAEFRTLVDMFQGFLDGGRFTPSELREAVIYAAALVEYRTVRPLIYGPDALFDGRIGLGAQERDKNEP